MANLLATGLLGLAAAMAPFGEPPRADDTGSQSVRLAGHVEPLGGATSGPAILPVPTVPPSSTGLGETIPNEVHNRPPDPVESNAASVADVPQLEDFAWRKGQYRIVPYGIGWLSMAFDSSRMPTVPIFVFSDDIEGEPSFNINARATRFGVEVTGPVILSAETAGRIEFDFFGVAETENRTGVLVRHAYGEFKTESWRVLAGQTWDVISPFYPGMLNYAVGWGGGNIGYRRAQLRGERYYWLDDETKFTLQASLNRTIVSDFATAGTIEGEDAGWPTIMGRAAVTLSDRCDPQHATEIGISGHIGQEQVDFQTPPIADDERFLSWSVNTDVRVPFGNRYGVQGEFFVGDVLGTFLGGVNQGIDPIGRAGIHSIGGWVEFWAYLTDQIHTHVGYGIDDPRDSDLTFSPSGRRSRNQFYFGNIVYNVTPLFTVGLEWSWWQTDYVGLAGGESFRVEAVVKYQF